MVYLEVGAVVQFCGVKAVVTSISRGKTHGGHFDFDHAEAARELGL
jgi:hypothetical protein